MTIGMWFLVSAPIVLCLAAAVWDIFFNFGVKIPSQKDE